jgi:hypothetical protein
MQATYKQLFFKHITITDIAVLHAQCSMIGVVIRSLSVSYTTTTTLISGGSSARLFLLLSTYSEAHHHDSSVRTEHIIIPVLYYLHHLAFLLTSWWSAKIVLRSLLLLFLESRLINIFEMGYVIIYVHPAVVHNKKKKKNTPCAYHWREAGTIQHRSSCMSAIILAARVW